MTNNDKHRHNDGSQFSRSLHKQNTLRNIIVNKMGNQHPSTHRQSNPDRNHSNSYYTGRHRFVQDAHHQQFSSRHDQQATNMSQLASTQKARDTHIENQVQRQIEKEGTINRQNKHKQIEQLKNKQKMHRIQLAIISSKQLQRRYMIEEKYKRSKIKDYQIQYQPQHSYAYSSKLEEQCNSEQQDNQHPTLIPYINNRIRLKNMLESALTYNQTISLSKSRSKSKSPSPKKIKYIGRSRSRKQEDRDSSEQSSYEILKQLKIVDIKGYHQYVRRKTNKTQTQKQDLKIKYKLRQSKIKQVDKPESRQVELIDTSQNNRSKLKQRQQSRNKLKTQQQIDDGEVELSFYKNAMKSEAREDKSRHMYRNKQKIKEKHNFRKKLEIINNTDIVTKNKLASQCDSPLQRVNTVNPHLESQIINPGNGSSTINNGGDNNGHDVSTFNIENKIKQILSSSRMYIQQQKIKQSNKLKKNKNKQSRLNRSEYRHRDNQAELDSYRHKQAHISVQRQNTSKQQSKLIQSQPRGIQKSTSRQNYKNRVQTNTNPQISKNQMLLKNRLKTHLERQAYNKQTRHIKAHSNLTLPAQLQTSQRDKYIEKIQKIISKTLISNQGLSYRKPNNMGNNYVNTSNNGSSIINSSTIVNSNDKGTNKNRSKAKNTNNGNSNLINRYKF